MTWVRVDDCIVDNDDVAQLGDAALGGLLRLEAWASKQLKDRVVPLYMVRRLGCARYLASMHKAKAIESVGEDAIRIVVKYFHVLSAEEVIADREAAAERQRLVREKRRQARVMSNGGHEGHAVTPPVTPAVIAPVTPGVTAPVSPRPPTRPDPTRPDPIKSDDLQRAHALDADEEAPPDFDEPPRGWNEGAFQALWTNTLQRAAADRYTKNGQDRWRDLTTRIATDAGLLHPPMAPAEYGKLLMLELPAYAEHAKRAGEKLVPDVTVACFEGWYGRLTTRVHERLARKAAPVAAPVPAACEHPTTGRTQYVTPDRRTVRGWFYCAACRHVCAGGVWYPMGQEPDPDQEQPMENTL